MHKRFSIIVYLSILCVLFVSSTVIAAQDEDPITCPGSPTPRLVVGDEGRVTPGSGNRLRIEPTTDGAEVGLIPGGDPFRVLDGPVCADDYVWWQVTYNEITGWTVEGSGDDYWLEPTEPLVPYDIVFVSQEDRISWLMAVDDQGREVIDLSEPDMTTYYQPLVSPDGTQIAYTTVYNATYELRIMPVTGGDAVILDRGTSPYYRYGDFAWSPDSRYIAFIADPDQAYEGEDWNVYIIDAGGQNRRAITDSVIEYSQLTWSPDSTHVAYAVYDDDANTSIHIMNITTGETRQISPSNYSVKYPNWSPDGSVLVFGAYALDDSTDSGLQHFVATIDGSDIRQPTGAGMPAWEAVWSPDGRRLAFVAARDGDSDMEVYIVNTDGSDLRQLTNNDANEACPAWSPDGSQVAFISAPQSTATSHYAVHVIRADGSDLRRLTNHERRDGCPSWVP